MYYLAKWRLNGAGQIILPGTVFEAEFTEEQEKRLLKLGAIVRTGEPELVNELTDDAPGILLSQAEGGSMDGETDAPDNQEGDGEEPEEPPQNGVEDDGSTEDDTAGEEAAEDEEEADDDAPVPVIDVAEGVVDVPVEHTEKKPAQKKNNGRVKK